jgi:hypothetical protein
VAVVDDFHEVTALTSGQAVGGPAVKDEQVRLYQGPEDPWEASVAVGEFEVGKQTGQSLVDDGEVVAASHLTEGTGQLGLSNAAGACDHQVAGVVDPTPGGELLELRPVQFARRPEVDVFDRRSDMAQLCAAHAGLEAPGVAACDLAFD